MVVSRTGFVDAGGMGRRRVSSFSAPVHGAARLVLKEAGSVLRWQENCPLDPRWAPGFKDQVKQHLVREFGHALGWRSSARGSSLS